MANTMHGPFVKGASLATGSYGTGVGQTNTYTSGNANNDETQSAVALGSLNGDLLSAFVLSGVACVKDATTASQLDVTSGVAYLTQTDGSRARCDVAATTFSATGNPSTTLYLDLNPDGSWSWATTHSASAHYLPICQVTTDGSANIASVTDKRVLLAALLSGAAHPSVTQPGGVSLPAPLCVQTTQNASLAATVVGGVTFGQMSGLSGSMDGAASFDGTSGYLAAPSSGLPTGAAAFSMEAWIKFSAAPATNRVFFWMGTALVGQEVLLYVDTNGKVNCGNASVTLTSAAALSVNAWHHIVGTYDGANLRLYVDGALAAGPTATTNNLAYGGAQIGAQNGALFWPGLIDECAIYATALSGAQITNHYSAGTSTTSDGYASAVLALSPLRYYRLGDAAGASSAACATSPTTQTLIDAAGVIPGVLTRHIGVAAQGDLIDTVGTSTSSDLAVYFKAGSGGWYYQSPNGTTVAQMGSSGNFARIANQATAGSFGVPVIVAQAVNQHVSVTTLQTILTYTPTTTGLYRINASMNCNNGGTNKPALGFSYTGGNSGVNIGTVFLAGPNGSVQDGTATILANFDCNLTSQTFYAAGGAAITCVYQNNSGAPNDHVTFIIERLS